MVKSWERNSGKWARNSVLANMREMVSFIDTKADDMGGGVFTKDAIGVSDGAK